jgi:cyclopropane fatty-acyl-phospholipid synthase-like methyltransferase
VTYTETHVVAAIEQLAAQEIGALTQSQLDGIDQFHAGGAEAVDRILPALHLHPGTTALDVGSGLGGPARQVARTTGCDVLGVDITRSYVDTATALTRAAGLGHRIAFLHTDVSNLERRDFDAAYTMHVQMNIADKKAFFTDIGHRLRQGARLAVFEVCRSGQQEPDLPLPWSIDGSDSFLVTPDNLLGSIEDGGFETVEWVDDTGWVIEWFQDLGVRLARAGTAATLPALLDDGPTRMMNFAGALGTGVLSIHRGVFTRE